MRRLKIDIISAVDELHIGVTRDKVEYKDVIRVQPIRKLAARM